MASSSSSKIAIPSSKFYMFNGSDDGSHARYLDDLWQSDKAPMMAVIDLDYGNWSSIMVIALRVPLDVPYSCRQAPFQEMDITCSK
ncbi:hypothetical protein E3N88_39728 [Mikania micrantha]|uniref:Uncharacterized protein n=1 Tax=Mikania micrantha TaxID=192012 RepID=A0A5N6LLH0_9ASTR|nr:hypothetical protein E3N88_39728 [Mikania micrantha]